MTKVLLLVFMIFTGIVANMCADSSPNNSTFHSVQSALIDLFNKCKISTENVHGLAQVVVRNRTAINLLREHIGNDWFGVKLSFGKNNDEGTLSIGTLALFYFRYNFGWLANPPHFDLGKFLKQNDGLVKLIEQSKNQLAALLMRDTLELSYLNDGTIIFTFSGFDDADHQFKTSYEYNTSSMSWELMVPAISTLCYRPFPR
jgi:hypothetical protein